MKRPTAETYDLWECQLCRRLNVASQEQCTKCGHSNPNRPRRATADAIPPLFAPDPMPNTVTTPTGRAGAAKAPRESELQKQCEQCLTFWEVEYLHLSPRAREKPGWPDLTFAIHGRPYGIELKTATGKVTEDQADCHARLRRNGWTVAVCRSLDEFREVAKQEG